MNTSSSKVMGVEDTRTTTIVRRVRKLLDDDTNNGIRKKIFRAAANIYSERKMYVAVAIHFFLTLVIWGHFAIIKFRTQDGNVPDTAPRYYWKIYAPTLEFGSMHAILFQMALLPLTMSRLTISMLGNTPVSKFFPLNRMLEIHIHLGYTMVLIVFLAVVFFFIFFGLLCSDGEQQFCDNFTSEIMITGYVILGTLLFIAGSSYARERIPYEIFYALHHVVFIMFAITVAHTLDDVQRDTPKERSQTFKWFSASLMYYICDRAAMSINHRYESSIASATPISTIYGSNMLIIKFKRPLQFHFESGQYAFLRVPWVDNHWHPFSIASAPESDYLEFCIEDCGEGSWTNKLWKILDSLQGISIDVVPIEVIGPYGTPFSGDNDEFSHVIAIGTGTGIVPMLSMFRKHVLSLLKLDTVKYIQESDSKVVKINNLYLNTRDNEKSILGFPKDTAKVIRTGGDDDVTSSFVTSYSRNIMMLQSTKIGAPLNSLSNEDKVVLEAIQRKAMTQVNLFILRVLLLLVPILGVVTLGMSLSWNTLREHTIVVKDEKIPVEPLPGLREVLIVCTILFQVFFLIETILIRPATKMFTLIDWTFIVIGVLSDWYWFEEDLWCSFDNSQNLFYSLQVGYMTFRAWGIATNFGSNFFDSLSRYEKFAVPQKFHLIWSSRSSLLISKILPEICSQWDELHHKWGDRAMDLCQVSIYVTDNNQTLVNRLKEEIKHTSIARNNWIKFERPNFQDILEDEAIKRIEGPLLCSSTLVAFCGSKRLANTVHEAKVRCDMATVVSENYGHVCQFESESYGVRKEEKEKPIIDEGTNSIVTTTAIEDNSEGAKVEDNNDVPLLLSSTHLSFRSHLKFQVEPSNKGIMNI